jgi:hypothetical protein
MSTIFPGILGALAVTLSLGAAQYASGSDLVGLARQSGAAVPQTTINRATKADRAGLPATALKTRTISVTVDGLSDTSVLVRMPVVTRQEARNTAPAPVPVKQPVTRTVACEPVVSVLTEVAKQLQPGRCVT